MAGTKVIVFGATGQVGSVTAIAAQKQGAKVYLALRDVKKAIPDLSTEEEQKGGFERVQADLSDNESIRDAVTQTGAKHAFVYYTFTATDGMQSIFETLKSAGITYAVFLSTWNLEVGEQRDLTKVRQSELIDYIHAQAAISMGKVFGPHGFATIRPGYFASNTLRFAKMLNAGHVKVPFPEAKFDWITAADIGAVCGNILAKGPQGADGKTSFGLCGPQILSYRETLTAIGKTLGQDIQLTPLGEDDGVKSFIEDIGYPPPLAQALVKVFKEAASVDQYARGYDEAVNNIRKYGGKEPMTCSEWIAANKQNFSA